jgi:hypothetical protein
MWLTANSLVLNHSKTELIFLGNSSHLDQLPLPLTITLLGHQITSSTAVRDLGVTLDGQLTLDQHTSNIIKSSFDHLKLNSIRKFIDRQSTITLLHAFVLSRLDFCNSIFTSLSESNITRLQRVQNSAARLVFSLPSRSHVTGLLHHLHWLPIRFRIQYKLSLFAHKFLLNESPIYFTDLLFHHCPNRSLRSSAAYLLSNQSASLATARSSFSFLAPLTWNSLPVTLRQPMPTIHFKKLLKTYLFSLAFRNA